MIGEEISQHVKSNFVHKKTLVLGTSMVTAHQPFPCQFAMSTSAPIQVIPEATLIYSIFRTNK